MADPDRVAVVTGAARGLGQEYARRLAGAGMAVVAADVRDAGETAEAVTGDGGQAIAITTDVTDIASCEAMVAAAVDAFGRIDVLVNNAALYGDATGGRFDAIEEADWDTMDGDQRQGHLELLQGRGAADAQGRGRLDHQYRLAGGDLRPCPIRCTTRRRRRR